MAFKINPPYVVDNTPIHMVDLEEGVMGRTNKNGVILVNKKLSDKDIEKVIAMKGTFMSKHCNCR